MLKGKDWNDFFYNGENKEDLIQMICSFMKNATNSVGDEL